MAAKIKVLLVDDEKGILRVLSIKLKISGYEVVTATCGQEACDLIETANPDVMVLDVVMPGMDGLELLQKLRLTSSLPVIVYSARPSLATEAMRCGADDFLPKPFDVNELVKRIEALLHLDESSAG